MAHGVSFLSTINNDLESDVIPIEDKLFLAKYEIARLRNQVQLEKASVQEKEYFAVDILVDEFLKDCHDAEIQQKREKEIQALTSQVQELRTAKTSDASVLAAKVDQLMQKVDQLQGDSSKTSLQIQQKLLEENRSLTARLADAEARNAKLEKCLKEAEEKAKAIADRLADQRRKAQEQLTSEIAQSIKDMLEADALLAAALKKNP